MSTEKWQSTHCAPNSRDAEEKREKKMIVEFCLRALLSCWFMHKLSFDRQKRCKNGEDEENIFLIVSIYIAENHLPKRKSYDSRALLFSFSFLNPSCKQRKKTTKKYRRTFTRTGFNVPIKFSIVCSRLVRSSLSKIGSSTHMRTVW